MKTTVVSKEYENLNRLIVTLQEKWRDSLAPEAVEIKVDQAASDEGIPLAALASFHVDIPLFLQWVDEISEVLVGFNQDFSEKLSVLRGMMDEETAGRWAEEALAMNHMYFAGFAKENGLDGWLPPFLAETAIRPYLQRLAQKVQPHITYGVHGKGCPVCGEPARLSVLDEEGKKVIQCPRCLAQWNAKRLECPHCGNEDHESIRFLTLEEDPVSQIQVCGECRGYLKVIDTGQYISKPSAAMLDLTTLHLDFVAQDRGFEAGGSGQSEN